MKKVPGARLRVPVTLPTAEPDSAEPCFHPSHAEGTGELRTCVWSGDTSHRPAAISPEFPAANQLLCEEVPPPPGAAMEEWRQCGRWLIDCKVLPPNHRVVWPSAAVFDLAQALRDGVLMCQMLHNLSPGSVDLKEINFRPQMSQHLLPVAPQILTQEPSCHKEPRSWPLVHRSPVSAPSGLLLLPPGTTPSPCLPHMFLFVVDASDLLLRSSESLLAEPRALPEFPGARQGFPHRRCCIWIFLFVR
ncbi:unnamed protein product [Pleuronectes platessa]|uniref:Calponin-homology (CH) domain-containing protein n=1 Tax=Pleuronectes platessa TaxID=8262 RepID=A0A9N7TUG4_PLEPL|nr:unnamed protein product [Pleuronectes platessa]